MTKGPAASDEQHFGPFSAAGFTSWPPLRAKKQFAELDVHNFIERLETSLALARK
jgi:hypothetical protein